MIVLRNSDRYAFKRCRRQWYFTSQMPGMRGLEPIKRNSALWLGTAVHKALERYYVRGTVRGVDPVETFRDYVFQWKFDHRREMHMWGDEDYDALVADVELGEGMLTHYAEYAARMDNFEVIEPEQEFLVPVRDHGEQLTLCGEPIFHGGRFDGIIRDDDRRLWLLEHKTAKYFDDRKLMNDEQVTTYLWAANQIYGYTFAGVLHNDLIKKVPCEPELVYKGKALSKSEETLGSTTFALYASAIVENGFDMVDYVTQLDALQARGWKPYFERRYVERSPREIEEMHERIICEARDMFREDLYIYPAPDAVKCVQCAFREPCLLMSDGGDYEYVLSENYKRRESSEFEPAPEEMPI